MTGQNQPTESDSQLSWLFLALAAILLCFANGRWQIPMAAWFAPVFLFLFIQSHRLLVGLGIGFLAQLGAFFINWWGIIPLPGGWYYVAAGVYATVYFFPFVAHRLLTDRHSGFRSTFILPIAWVTVELLVAKFTPYGTWASLGYTQVENLPLLQIVSITGLAGVSFLMLWFVAVCGWLWQRRRRGASSIRFAVVYICVLLAVLVFGETRLSSTRSNTETVRVAGITPSADLSNQLYESMVALQGNATDATSLDRVRRIADQLNADLLNRSRAEALAGAELIVWAEHAARVTGESELALIQHAQGIASEFSVHMVLGMGTWNPDKQPSFENKIAMISPEGKHTSTYWKAKPIVGQESSLIRSGDESPAIWDTDRARIAAVICHDLDFPDYVRQVGANGVDILLGPSSDWEAITPLHPHMAVVRAVENGCSLVRPCSNGLSLSVDALGRTLVYRIDEGSSGNVTISHIPIEHRITLFSRVGELFSYLNLAALLLLFVGAATRAMGSRRA